MERKIEVDCLNKEELTYEMIVRGLAAANVDSMRKSLRQVFKLELDKSTFSYPEYPFDFVTDCQGIQATYDKAEGLIGTIVGDRKSRPYRKLQSLLSHLLGRVDNLVVLDNDQKSARATYFTEILNLMADAEARVSTPAEPSDLGETPRVVTQDQGLTLIDFLPDDLPQEPADLSLAQMGSGNRQSTPATTGRNVEGCPAASSTCVEPLRPAASHMKPVPVLKWGIKFSGRSSSVSLSAFLKHLEELRVARNVSKEQLFASALDFFTGEALLWFRFRRAYAVDWDSLVVLLKEEYLPPDYDDRLLDEIKRRTQDPKESIGSYVTVMEGLFSRMTSSMSEDKKLSILMRNLAPLYQMQLMGAIDIKSLDQLIAFGRKVESRKALIDGFVPPAKRKTDLEPDLAFIQAESVSGLTAEQGSELVCFNCRNRGHKRANCLQPKVKRCFGCGELNQTKYSCPKCNQGNSSTRR